MTKQIDKPIFASKINWLAFGLAVLGGLANPKVYEWLEANGIAFSPVLVAVAIQVGAVLVYIFRTYYTVCSAPDLVNDPRMDSIPTDVKVDSIVKDALHKVEHGYDNFKGKIEP